MQEAVLAIYILLGGGGMGENVEIEDADDEFIVDEKAFLDFCRRALPSDRSDLQKRRTRETGGIFLHIQNPKKYIGSQIVIAQPHHMIHIILPLEMRERTEYQNFMIL